MGWPLVLDALATAQSDLLAGRGRAPGAAVGEEEEGGAAQEDLAARCDAGVQAGSVAAGGGCTDASVRLGNILKVRHILQRSPLPFQALPNVLLVPLCLALHGCFISQRVVCAHSVVIEPG